MTFLCRFWAVLTRRWVRLSWHQAQIDRLCADATADREELLDRLEVAHADIRVLEDLVDRASEHAEALATERAGLAKQVDALRADNDRLLAEMGAADLRLLPVLTRTDDGPALHLNLSDDFSGSVMPVADWVRLLNPDAGPAEVEAAPEPLTGEIVPARKPRRRTTAGAG